MKTEKRRVKERREGKIREQRLRKALSTKNPSSLKNNKKIELDIEH